MPSAGPSARSAGGSKGKKAGEGVRSSSKTSAAHGLPAPGPSEASAGATALVDARLSTRPKTVNGTEVDAVVRVEELKDPTPTLKDLIRANLKSEREAKKQRILKEHQQKSEALKLLEAGQNDSDHDPERADARALGGQATTSAAVASAAVVSAPQVQVVDGQIVINESSLHVVAGDASNGAARSRGVANNHGSDGATRVVEEGTGVHGPKLNSGSYSNRERTVRWSADETDLFYKAISQFGLDFSLIEKLFPQRSRKQIKRKYLAEESKNRGKLEDCLKHEPNRDLEQYRQMIAHLRAGAAKEAGVADDAEEEEAAVEAEAPTMADPGASTDVQIGLDASIAIVHTETGADGATQTADGGSGAATRSRKTAKKRGARDKLPESAVAASAHDGQTNPQAAAADVPGDEDAPTRRASLRQRRK